MNDSAEFFEIKKYLRAQDSAQVCNMLASPFYIFTPAELIYVLSSACAPKFDFDIIEAILGRLRFKIMHVLQYVYHRSIPCVFKMILDRKIDLEQGKWTQHYGLLLSIRYGHEALAKRLICSPHFDADYGCSYIEEAQNAKLFDLCGHLLAAPIDVWHPDMPILLDNVKIIRWRTFAVCMALQDLHLPALVTLEIIDQLMPNTVTMAKKWKLIATIKHFHHAFDY